jgi:hypothetical protein
MDKIADRFYQFVSSKKIDIALVAVACLAVTPAKAVSAICAPVDVTVFKERIHVRCGTEITDGASKVVFFAVPTTDSIRANRFMTITTSALVAGRRVIINFTSGSNGASYGCLKSDCRPVDWYGIE